MAGTAVPANLSRSLLQARGIGKSFGSVRALADVDMDLHRGEMLGLVGANGAGKSTLIKIVCGAVTHDVGELIVDGAPVRFRSVADALAAGIAVAHQHLAIIPRLTAAENIMLGREPLGGFLIRNRALNAEARRFADQFGVDIDLGAECETLTLGENKILDILKALVSDPRILILDEPTASLTLNESRRLFAFLDDLKARGIGIVFISHHLNEVFAHCDRVVVLKDGRRVHEGKVAELDPPELVRLMVGRTIEDTDWTSHAATSAVSVSIRDMRFGRLSVPELTVHRGEVVGIAGVLGAGQTGLLESLAGSPPAPVSGPHASCLVNGQPGLPKRAADAIARRVYLVADERIRKALFPGLTVEENLNAGSLDRISRLGFVRRDTATRRADASIEGLRVKCENGRQDIMQLSGGNQQKIVFGRWLTRIDGKGDPLFLLDNPTEGVDVGSKAELYALIRTLARQGASVLISSAEFAELIALCDRIYCITQNSVGRCLSRAEFSEDRLLLEVS